MLSNVLSLYYSKLGKCFCKSLFSVLDGVLKSCSSNTAEIAKAMSTLNNKSFNTNDKAISYLYSNNKFQVDDTFWRCHINMVFAAFHEQDFIKKGDKVFIQVDFTSDCNDFLILCASVIYNGRAIPLYFTMRNYPKQKNSYNHKKMELAFLRALKHCLSAKYQYVIVADRGFGNDRFIQYCEDCDFEYTIRLQPNMKAEYGNKKGILSDIIKDDGSFEVRVKKWNRDLTIFKNTKDDKEWYLSSNIKGLTSQEVIQIYNDRFKIEKCFQDLKSSGFDIESSKIKKYDRFKRMLTMCVISHSIAVITGSFISKHMPAFKKNFPTHTNLISAYLPLQSEHYLASLAKH
jgi:hypothetical protein